MAANPGETRATLDLGDVGARVTPIEVPGLGAAVKPRVDGDRLVIDLDARSGWVADIG